MSDKTECRLCGQELPSGLVQMDARITKSVGWHTFSTIGATRTILEVGTVETIASHVVEGERHYGGDIQAQIVVVIGGLLYRKLGTTDSYGETSWDGALVQVQPKTQSIKAWERL